MSNAIPPGTQLVAITCLPTTRCCTTPVPITRIWQAHVMQRQPPGPQQPLFGRVTCGSSGLSNAVVSGATNGGLPPSNGNAAMCSHDDCSSVVHLSAVVLQQYKHVKCDPVAGRPANAWGWHCDTFGRAEYSSGWQHVQVSGVCVPICCKHRPDMDLKQQHTMASRDVHLPKPPTSLGAHAWSAPAAHAASRELPTGQRLPSTVGALTPLGGGSQGHPAACWRG
jgi:hypothetical protein